ERGEGGFAQHPHHGLGRPVPTGAHVLHRADQFPASLQLRGQELQGRFVFDAPRGVQAEPPLRRGAKVFFEQPTRPGNGPFQVFALRFGERNNAVRRTPTQKPRLKSTRRLYSSESLWTRKG